MSNNDFLCYDKHQRNIREGDQIRINTAGSLNGVFPVTRSKRGELQIGGQDLWGFYPGTYEVVEVTP